MQIAIIGAGIAGLTAAQTCLTDGIAAVVFEKSGRPGGRCATRQTELGLFNHGAPRAHQLPDALADRLSPDRDGHRAVPGMNTLGRILAHRLDIRHRITMSEISRISGGWQIEDQSFDALIVAIPAPQATQLFDNFECPRALHDVEMRAQLTAMLAYGRPQACHGDPGMSIEPMNAEKTRFVVHSSPEFTARHLEAEKPRIAAALAARFSKEPPDLALGHRWRYARTVKSLGQNCLHVPDSNLAFCGDWCLGPTVGDAIRSGRAAAQSILGQRAA